MAATDKELDSIAMALVRALLINTDPTFNKDHTCPAVIFEDNYSLDIEKLREPQRDKE